MFGPEIYFLESERIWLTIYHILLISYLPLSGQEWTQLWQTNQGV